jgi:hypothetical protein
MTVLDDLATVAQKILEKRKFTCFYLEVHSLRGKKLANCMPRKIYEKTHVK